MTNARSGYSRRRRRDPVAPVDGTALRRAWLPLALLCAAFVVLALGGGSNRTDVLSLLYVRPALVLVLVGMVLLVPGAQLRPFRVPLMFLLCGVALVLVQLVPLPPALWTALPGRELMLEAARAQGVAQPWRPISLTPDLTVQALLWFLAPACALVGWAAVPADARRPVLFVLLGVGVASALLGGLQVTQGVGSPLYLYRRTYEGNAVGFLANRNHQAALLAAMFPLLRVVTLLPATTHQAALRRLIAAGLCALALVPLILLTGSRAGMGLAVVGMVMAGLIAPSAGGRTGRFVSWGLLGGGVAIAALVFLFGRALAIDRLFELNALDDLRLRNTPQVLRMTWDFFPFGSGLGSFDPVFRILEPDVLLRPTTYNHAHNDFFEVAMTGGVAGIALMVAGLAWWLTAGWRLFRGRERAGFGGLLGRAGWSVLLILILASTVDYPLRPPLMGFVFALAAAWVAQALHRSSDMATALQKSEAGIGKRTSGKTYEELNP